MSEHQKKPTPAMPPAGASSQSASPASRSAPEKSHATIASGTGDTSVAPERPGDSPAGGAASLAVPSEFGRYKILRSLGQGAMGVVYLAEDTQLKRQVALKIPQLESTSSGARLERFYREARLAATLRHPNLCPIHDVGEFQGTHFISMAYIEGKPLDALLKSGKRQSERAAAGLVRKIALALEEAHSRDVIHRDLKPANIMIDQRGEPIVMDFGLARQMNSTDQAQITHSGAILGTPSYMSPEQVQGKTGEVAAASDVYALGVILYQLLAGRLPFEGPVISVLAQIATQAPAPPSSFRDTLSPEIEAICLKAMAKRAGDRFASMAQFAAALTQYLRKSPDRAEQSRTGSAEKAAASAGAPAAAGVPGDVSDRSSPTGPASVIAASSGKRLAAKWRKLSRPAQIATAGLGVAALVALAVVIVIERRDGGQTKVAVADGDEDEALIAVKRDRLKSKREKIVEEPRGSDEFEPLLTDGALSEVKPTEDQDPSPTSANATVAADDNATASDVDEVPASATVPSEPADSPADDEPAQAPDDADVNEKIKKLDKKIGGSKQKKSRAAPVDDLSLFPAGSVWRGSYGQAVAGNKKTDTHNISLTVTDRTNGRFRIEVAIDGGRHAAYETEGIIYNGIVEWNTVDARVTKGSIGRHAYRGLISNGDRLEFLISGLTREGKQTSCAGTVNRQEIKESHTKKRR